MTRLHDDREREEQRPRAETSQETSGPTLLELQRAVGNRAVNALLARRPLARQNYQLQTPEVGSSIGWRSRTSLGTPQLHLDPQIAAQARAGLAAQLRPRLLIDELRRLPSSAFRQRQAVPSAALQLDPAPDSGPAPDPASPRGFEEPAHNATAGMLIAAVLQTPQGARAVENLRRQALHGLTSGQRNVLIWTGLGFGLGALGGMLATPRGRDTLGQLSGTVIPVPISRLPGLAIEFTSLEPHIGFGLHFDLGRYLPARFSFGPAGPLDTPIPLYGGGGD